MNIDVDVEWGPELPVAIRATKRDGDKIDWEIPPPEGYTSLRLDIMQAWVMMHPTIPFSLANVARVVKRLVNEVTLILESGAIRDLALPAETINASRAYRTLSQGLDRLSHLFFLYSLFKKR